MVQKCLVSLQISFSHNILSSTSIRTVTYSRFSTKTAVPTLDRKKVQEHKFVFTEDQTEQRQIANYLDNKCTEIDSLVAIMQQKIEELKEYKKSIIYEYVTGKKAV